MRFNSGLRNVHACIYSRVSIDLLVIYRTRKILDSAEFLHRVEHWPLRHSQLLGVWAADMNRNSGISIGVWGLDGISKSIKRGNFDLHPQSA